MCRIVNSKYEPSNGQESSGFSEQNRQGGTDDSEGFGEELHEIHSGWFKINYLFATVVFVEKSCLKKTINFFIVQRFG